MRGKESNYSSNPLTLQLSIIHNLFMARKSKGGRDKVVRMIEKGKPGKEGIKGRSVTVVKDGPMSRGSLARKAAAKPATFRRTLVKDGAIPKPEGYVPYKDSHILVPRDTVVVEPSALRKGIEKAKKEIRALLDEFISIVIVDGHKISEIELSVSFDAKGTFLGIGIGGATSIKIKIVPSDN